MMAGDTTPGRPVSTAVSPTARPHLHAIDLMRVITIVGVIAVHVVSFTNREDSITAGAVLALLHVNREVFIVLTAAVLTYSFVSTREKPDYRFWVRRYWLVGLPYLVWTGLYFVANGESLTSVPHALGRLGTDLMAGTARYNLYFLLVTMQMYLVFPLFLLLIRATRGHHRALLGISLLVQVAFTAMIHYQVPAPGLLGSWLAHPDALLPSYQLYVVAGALMADHLPDLTRWVRRHRALVVMVVLAAAAAALGSYLNDVYSGYLPPLLAGQVFQPAVTVESLAAVLGLYTLGSVWAGWRRPGWLARLIASGSDASFGIYLAHPLILQALLALAAFTGLLEALTTASSRVALAVGLLGVVPLVFVATWGLVRLARGTRLSVPLTGRRTQALARDGQPARSRPHRRWAFQGMGAIGIATLIGVVGLSHLSAGRIAAAGLTPDDVPNPTRTGSPSTMARPMPRTGTTSTMETVTAGGLQRSYRVIRPAYQEAATLPVIVVLHGISASIDGEEQRDGLLPLVVSGQAILVYPVGFGQSWNDGTCCGMAHDRDVDDVRFLSTTIRRAGAIPGAEPNGIYLVGFSNGGKMAYRLVCAKPWVAAAVAVVAAVPAKACPHGPAVSLLQIATTADPEIPLKQTRAQVDAWRARDGCPAGVNTHVAGDLTTQSWSGCRHGASVELATYRSAKHTWPPGGNGTPGAADLIWTFVKSQRKAS